MSNTNCFLTVAQDRFGTSKYTALPWSAQLIIVTYDALVHCFRVSYSLMVPSCLCFCSMFILLDHTLATEDNISTGRYSWHRDPIAYNLSL